MTDYTLGSGRYFWQNNKLIKAQYDDGKAESDLAAKSNHPYDFKLLESATAGTNDCVIVARLATPEFLEALKYVMFPGSARGNDSLGDPLDYMTAEVDTYIRKSDGIIMGQVTKDRSGEVKNDKHFTVIEADIPVAGAEFDLPRVAVETATNVHQLLHIVSSGRHNQAGLTPLEFKLVRYGIVATMVISLVVLLVFVFLKIRHGDPA